MVLEEVSLDGQRHDGSSVFPLAYQATSGTPSLDEMSGWTNANRESLLKTATEHGAILFRDCGLDSVDAFDAFVQSLDIPNFPYKRSLSNAVRVNRTERVFSANEAPPEVQIFFHHEMAQTPIYPEWIMFYCEIAAESGGATPICRSDVLFERLQSECSEFAAACESKGLQYTNVMPDDDDPESGMGRSWRSTLGTDTREGAEERLRELNYSWQWLPDGSLKATTPPLPAVMEVSPGRKTFFNQLIAAFSGWKDARNDPSESIRHGDGSKLDADAVRRSIEISEEIAFDVPWQSGDAVLIDNRVVMHARRSFVGKRKVVASLGQMRSQSFQLEAQPV